MASFCLRTGYTPKQYWALTFGELYAFYEVLDKE